MTHVTLMNIYKKIVFNKEIERFGHVVIRTRPSPLSVISVISVSALCGIKEIRQTNESKINKY